MRELKLHGADWVKVYTTQDFVGDDWVEFRPDGSLVASPSLTLEEVQAIVDDLLAFTLISIVRRTAAVRHGLDPTRC